MTKTRMNFRLSERAMSCLYELYNCYGGEKTMTAIVEEAVETLYDKKFQISLWNMAVNSVTNTEED